jgi:conjugal transfer pilus assembly protein TraV
MDDGIDTPVHIIAAPNAPAVSRPAPSYELSVVFPAYTDASGASHARRVVRTQAGLPGRGEAMDAMAKRGSQPSRNRGLLAAAESAPALLAIAPGVLSAAVPPASDEVTAQAAAADRPNPIEAIEDKVKERLSAQPQVRRQAASFPGTVE